METLISDATGMLLYKVLQLKGGLLISGIPYFSSPFTRAEGSIVTSIHDLYRWLCNNGTVLCNNGTVLYNSCGWLVMDSTAVHTLSAHKAPPTAQCQQVQASQVRSSPCGSGCGKQGTHHVAPLRNVIMTCSILIRLHSRLQRYKSHTGMMPYPFSLAKGLARQTHHR